MLPTKITRFLILMSLTFFSATISAQTIHAIICGGTNIPDIGTGCKASVQLMQDALEVIESQSEMTLETHLLVGNDFTKSNITKTINSINPGSDDVILFYSTSHGFNYNDNTSKYTFIMAHPTQPEGADQLDLYGLSLEKEVYNVLKTKGARLTITMAEACNNVIDIPSPSRYKAMSPIVKRNIKALFKDSKGSIISCSSTYSEYSYTDEKEGGFYTNMFMESLNDVVTASEMASWEKLLTLTRDKTKGFAQASGRVQVPCSNIVDTSIKYPYTKKEKKTQYIKSNLKQK